MNKDILMYVDNRSHEPAHNGDVLVIIVTIFGKYLDIGKRMKFFLFTLLICLNLYIVNGIIL
jgi:hypothetical protein